MIRRGEGPAGPFIRHHVSNVIPMNPPTVDEIETATRWEIFPYFGDRPDRPYDWATEPDDRTVVLTAAKAEGIQNLIVHMERGQPVRPVDVMTAIDWLDRV